MAAGWKRIEQAVTSCQLQPPPPLLLLLLLLLLL
jgi:hypothetical protein